LAGLDPAIHVLADENVDARVKHGHDDHKVNRPVKHLSVPVRALESCASTLRFTIMRALRQTSGEALRACAVAAGLALAGCEGSGRFTDFGPGRQAVAPPPRTQTFTPAPMGRVETSALPPLGSQSLPPPAPNPELEGLPPGPSGSRPSPGLPPAGSSVPIDVEPSRPAQRPLEPAPVEPRPAEPPPRMASRPEPAPQSSAPTRTGVTGNWNAKEAAGGSCRVTLSSAPTLDLYKASSQGCQSRELQRISAWELRGDEVYLYEPGGGVAARLKQSGRGFEGAAAKTGAPISLNK